MDGMRRLFKAVRGITPHGTICFHGVPHPVTGNGDFWRGEISVGGVIIAEHVGDMHEIVDELAKKMDAISEKVKKGLAPTEPPPED
jgi:hypothetical protein